MKRIVLFLVFISFFIPNMLLNADASLVSDRKYRLEQNRNFRNDSKQIKNLLKVHNEYANKHDLERLKSLYADSYINNDGFSKEVYFKSVDETWKECEDITYSTKILSIEINGDHASVNVEETATGTISDTMASEPVSGELHSKATGIYYLIKVNGKWLISGEYDLTDESSLLYGDARFMNIEIQAPNQVEAGLDYTTTVKIDADENTFIVGSIDRDPVTFPSGTPSSKLRAVSQNHVLERIIKANTDNLNEYVIASLAISKVRGNRMYIAGLACVMRRINVVPKNNFIDLEEKDENIDM